MTNTGNHQDHNHNYEQERELSATERHERAVIRMLIARGGEVSGLLGPTDQDPELDYEIGAALQNIEFAHWQISADSMTGQHRQEARRYRAELTQILTTAGFDRSTQRQVGKVLDAQGVDAEHFRRAYLTMTAEEDRTAERMAAQSCFATPVPAAAQPKRCHQRIFDTTTDISRLWRRRDKGQGLSR